MLQRHQSGLTLVEVLVVVGIIVVLVAVMIPTLSHLRHTARQAANSTQLRGIHQSLITSGYSKSRGRGDGWYIGTNSKGELDPDGERTGHSGDGSVPAARYWWLMRGNYFTPEYAISPVDKNAVPAVWTSDHYPPLTPANFSYAMMSLLGTENEKAEWQETLNAQAVVLSDRAIGSGASGISSLWTEAGSGAWHGGVARNDNSVDFQQAQNMSDTQYGKGAVNAFDDLFADAPDADDAFLVFEDARTSYAKR